MTHAGFSLQLGINRGGQQGPAPVDLGAGRRVLRRAANELLGLVFHGVPFPPVIRAVRQVSPWQGDGPDFPAVSLRTSGLDLRGDGTDARSYIRDRRQQFTGHRCSWRGLADQEHRRISCDREHLHNALCRCHIGSEADSSPSHRSRKISSRSDAGDTGGLTAAR